MLKYVVVSNHYVSSHLTNFNILSHHLTGYGEEPGFRRDEIQDVSDREFCTWTIQKAWCWALLGLGLPRCYSRNCIRRSLVDLKHMQLWFCCGFFLDTDTNSLRRWNWYSHHRLIQPLLIRSVHLIRPSPLHIATLDQSVKFDTPA